MCAEAPLGGRDADALASCMLVGGLLMAGRGRVSHYFPRLRNVVLLSILESL